MPTYTPNLWMKSPKRYKALKKGIKKVSQTKNKNKKPLGTTKYGI